MNVKKGTRDLTWGQTIAGLTYGDANFTLSATSTNSGGITYASSDESIIEINGTSKTQHTLEDGLVWYWNFDNDQNGSSNAVNATIGGMNGTKGSGVTVVNGKFGNALNFDGSTNANSFVDFGSGSRTSFDGLFSVSFWVKRTGAYSGYGRIITNKSGSSTPGYLIYFSTTNDRLYVKGTTQSRYGRATSSWTAQNWVHVVTTFNAQAASTAQRYKMYADGSFVTQNDIPKIGPGSSNLIFGKSPGGGSRMIGSLDDVRFYDRELSGAEASTLYGSGNGDFVTVRTGTMASIKKAGTITLSGYAPGTTNMYGATPISKSVTVSKAPLTVTGDDFSINVGNTMPTLTSQTTGWKNGDTNASLSTQVSVTTDASNSNTAGTFYVRPGGAVSDKYVMTYVDGQFIITNKTPQSISWGQDFSSAAINQIIDLNASASSSLAVTYVVSDTSKAELAVTLQSNLDSWWKLDETSATTVADSSGSGSSSHTAVLIGTDGSSNWTDQGPPVSRQGKFGGALTLDGTNDYGYTSGYKGITGSTRRTLSLWFKTSTANKPILQYGASGTGTLFKVSINGSGAAVVDLGGVSITGGSSLANGAWHHLAVSVPESGNSGGVKLYVDGSATSGSGTTAVNTSNANDLKIGTDGSAYFNGQLDDIRLYQAELNSTMITKVYGGGTGDFNRLQLKASGSFTVTASQAGNGTYAVAPDVTETLNVGKLSQTIAFSPITDKSIGDFDFDPGATASSSLPVTYTSSAPLIASVEGTTAGSQKIKVRAAGQVTITASQAGDTAYNAASDANQTFTVGYYNLFADSLPGLKLWLDGNSVDSDHSSADIITNGTTIGSWKDRSASTNHATQGTSANRPTYTLNGLNSKGVLSYTAGQSSDISADSTIRSIFAVIKQASSQTAETQPFGGNIAGTTSAGKFGLKRTGSSMLDSGITSQSFAVVTWQMASGNYAVYINGEERVTGTDPNAPAAFTKIGNNFAGQIAEIVAYNAAMNTSVREKLEGYLGHKWGLNTSFPTSHTYKVAKPAFGGTQNLNFQTLPDRQTGQTVTLSVTADSGLSTFSYDSNDTNVVSFSGDVATALAVGKVRITATQAGNSNWLSANAYQDWIVTATPRSDQNITFAAIPNKNALSANFDLNATASSSLPVSFTSQTPNIATVDGNGTVTIKSTGVATFRASQDGNGSYNAAPTVDQTLTITKVPQTITFGSISNQNLSAGTYSLSATASSNLGVSFVSSNTSLGSVSGNVVTLVAGGTITITASQGGDSTYDAAPTVNQNLTIIDDTLTAQTITWSQSLSSLSYGTPDTNMTASASSGLAITYISSDSNVVDVNGSFLKIIGAGTATVSASQSGDGQYSAASTVDKNVTVSKANQTIVAANNATTLPNITKDSGDFEFSPGSKSVKTGTTTSTGLAVSYASSNSNVILVTNSGTRLKPVGGGTSTITVTQAGDSGYNPASSKTFTVTVTEYSPYNDSLPGMIFWLNANDVNGDGSPDATTDFTSIGGKVQPDGWADVSGNSVSFSQSSTSKQPVRIVQNGLPGLAFGSTLGNSGAYLSGSVPSSVNGNVGYTMVIAAKTSGTNSDRFFHFGASSGAAGQVIGLGVNGGFYFNGGGEQTFSGVNFGGNVQVGVFRRKAGSTYADSEFIFNGANQIGTAISGTSTPSIPSTGRDMLIGAGRNSSGAISSQLANAVIHEVMLFEGDLNDFAVRRLEGYLAYKWGSNARLNNGHPFGSSRPQFGGAQSITVAATNVPLDAADSNKPFMSTFDSPFELEGAYATSGLDIVYETNNSSVIAVNSAGELNPVGTGLVRVTLKQPGDSHFSAASNKTFDMKVIGKRPQTLSFTTVNETRIDQAMDLNGSSSAGLTVAYSITAGNSIASLSGTRLTFSGTGSVTIRASQSGNGTYAAAVVVDSTFLVKRPLTLIFDSIGDMGKQQQFTVRAVVLDGISNQPVQVSPTYSIISGPASVSGGQITCANTTGVVQVRAVATGAAFFTTTATTSFNVTNKQGQTIFFKQGEAGGLRDLPLSRKPTPLGRMASASSNLGVTFELTANPNNAMQINGSGAGAVLVFSKNFSGFGGADELTVSIKATQAGNGSYNAAADVIRDIKIKKPGKSAFFDERRMDPRYPKERDKFARKLFAKKNLKGLIDLDGSGSITIDDAKLLFDSDDFDSDGDGMSNFMERAFGGDSLSSDAKTTLPRSIRQKDGKQRITFQQYSTEYNSEGIEYIVETSTDLRTWTTTGTSQVDLNGGDTGSGIDIGGGMERVLWETSGTASSKGGKQFLRVRVRTK